MESSVFFKSQMSEKDYLYDFNTKQLTIVDPIVESLFNLDRQGKELSLFAVEHIYCHKRSLLMPKNSITIRKNINTLKNMAFLIAYLTNAYFLLFLQK